MSESPPRNSRRISRLYFAPIAACVFFIDQLSKRLVVRHIPLQSVIRVIPGFFNLTHAVNTGVAFSLFAGSPSLWKTSLLIAVSAALLVAVVLIVGRAPKLEWKSGFGLALIVGGALSNLVDRIRFGSVVDFLDFYFRSYHWPTFNLADSSIVIGAGLLILHVLLND